MTVQYAREACVSDGKAVIPALARTLMCRAWKATSGVSSPTGTGAHVGSPIGHCDATGTEACISLSSQNPHRTVSTSVPLLCAPGRVAAKKEIFS